MAKNVFQVTRTYYHKNTNYATWDAGQQEDGSWSVHFRADFVNNTDWKAADDADLMAKIQVEMVNWIAAISIRYKG